MPIDITQSDSPSGVKVLTVSGSMTMGSQMQRFEWQIEEFLKNSQNRIVIDLSGVTYMDSSAIGILVASSGRVKAAGGSLRIAGVSERVMSVLTMTGVNAVLALDANTNDSLAALENAG